MLKKHYATTRRLAARALPTPQPQTLSPAMMHHFDAGAVWFSLACAFLLSACNDGIDSTRRPQNPKTRPYHYETVRFAGGPGAALEGELSLPLAGAPFKTVVLISGSGPQDRDETIGGHKPFLILSDYLTRAGYAVLRYDDRGVGRSSGDYQSADLRDFTADAIAAYRYLESRSEIDNSQIGFIGHSEGGYIATEAALRVKPAFAIFLAGAARPLLPDVMITQTVMNARAEGESEAQISASVWQVRRASEILAMPVPLDRVRQELSEYMRSTGVGWFGRRQVLDIFATPWGVSYAKYDPRPSLRSLSVPVLALYGEKDMQVSPTHEVPEMRQALSHPQSKVEVFDGLNHMFQPSATGKPSEYAQIDTTMAPAVMDRIADWLGSL